MKKLFLLLLFAFALPACTSYDAATEESLFLGDHHVIAIIGADNVYVGNFHIKVPDCIDSNTISDVRIIFMGTLDDIFYQGFWECEAEIASLICHPLDDISAFLVFEFASTADEVLGHSITHSPVADIHVNTHECYSIVLTGIKRLMR